MEKDEKNISKTHNTCQKYTGTCALGAEVAYLLTMFKIHSFKGSA